MDNFYYISLVIVSIAIAITLFISFRIYRNHRDNEQSVQDELSSFINQQSKQAIELESILNEISALKVEVQKISAKNTDSHLLPLLSAVVERLENTPITTSSQQTEKTSPHFLEKDNEHSVFNHAIRLAKENQPAQKIVDICGIEPSEAELIVRMHSSKETS